MENAKAEFEKLYESTKHKLYSYIVGRCYAIDDIDDIFQNTCMEVYRALTRRKDLPPDPTAFVLLIAKRQLTRYYSFVRRMRENIVHRSNSDEEYDPDLPDGFDIEESLVTKERLEEITRLIEKKPLITQKVLFLHYRRDMTIAQIAELLMMSESAVKMHIYKTLEQIKRRIGKEQEL